MRHRVSLLKYQGHKYNLVMGSLLLMNKRPHQPTRPRSIPTATTRNPLQRGEQMAPGGGFDQEQPKLVS